MYFNSFAIFIYSSIHSSTIFWASCHGASLDKSIPNSFTVSKGDLLVPDSKNVYSLANCLSSLSWILFALIIAPSWPIAYLYTYALESEDLLNDSYSVSLFFNDGGRIIADYNMEKNITVSATHEGIQNDPDINVDD